MALLVEKSPILDRVFTPGQPVTTQQNLKGRIPQIHSCFDAISASGMHGVIFGERGVGKTSIANIIALLVTNEKFVIKISCNSEDTISSLWTRIFQQVLFNQKAPNPIGFEDASKRTGEQTSLLEYLKNIEFDINKLIQGINLLPKNSLVIIDEFDRLGIQFNKNSFADTIKYISDNLPDKTIFIVGVSETVSELIGAHQSIERQLRQIKIQTMNSSELNLILNNALDELGMDIEPSIAETIIDYSEGYPYIVHLLGLYSCRQALQVELLKVNQNHFNAAIKHAVLNAYESLRQTYQKATIATKENLYEEVLWACSMVRVDDHGCFQVKDLLDLVKKITNRQDITINHYSRHIGNFCTQERGSILKKIGATKRYRYKFGNPLFRAYVRLKYHEINEQQKLAL